MRERGDLHDPELGGLSEEKPAAIKLERDYSLTLVVSHSIATLLLMQVLWLGSNPWGFSSALSPGEQKKTRLLSCYFFAEREGFEPPDLLQSTVFKTAAFDRSAISPPKRTAKVSSIFKKQKKILEAL